jgi:CMP-N-acetylneuraminic acid synthetase
MKKITAVIPVRKGSQRVKNKNIKPFAGSSLLEIKIKKLLSLGSVIDNIIVTSDCPEMLGIARALGVDTHKRDEYYASSESTNSEFFENLAKSIDAEHFMYSPVTCPLISTETYKECLSDYQSNDNIVTVKPVKHHLWLDGKPYNYNLTESPNSQDLPDIYQVTYGVCLLSGLAMKQSKNVVTTNPTFKVLNEIESIDIDTEFDFLMAETIYNKLLGS